MKRRLSIGCCLTIKIVKTIFPIELVPEHLATDYIPCFIKLSFKVLGRGYAVMNLPGPLVIFLEVSTCQSLSVV